MLPLPREPAGMRFFIPFRTGGEEKAREGEVGLEEKGKPTVGGRALGK